MSRIEDALKKAGAAPPLPPRGVEANAPWQFGSAVVERRVDAPAPDPKPAVDGAPAATPAPATPVATAATATAPPAAREPSAPVAAPGTLVARFDDPLMDKVVVSSRMPSASLEQFRRLGGTLHHAQTQKGTRVILVASAHPREGKTLTATNLALTLSESYRRRVLLIDADLRRPTLHEIFSLPNVAGLNEALSADLDQKVNVTEVSPSLSILTAGAPDPDPMSALTSTRMRALLGEAAAAFEWVIIDTPPVALLTDAALLAAMVDGVILVVQAASTPYDHIQRTIDAIGRQRILGVVLNRAADGLADSGSYYQEYRRYAPRVETAAAGR